MFFSRMRATNIALILLLLLLTIGCASQYPEPPIYHDRLVKTMENSTQFRVGDVFDFEFDRAYIVGRRKEIYTDEKRLTSELHVKTRVHIPTLESGGHNRIVFVKDNVIIYDFIYEMHTLPSFDSQIWITPDTTAEYDQKTDVITFSDPIYTREEGIMLGK